MPKIVENKKTTTLKTVAKSKNKSVKKTVNTVATVAKDTKKTIVKKTTVADVKKDEVTALTFLEVWLNGWKKTFVLRGRSSRFELWCFLLLNSIISITIQLKCCYIMSSQFLISATEKGLGIETIDRYILGAEIVFYLAFLIPLFPLGSLLIRRMHDLGRLAWQNCLEPAFMGMCVLWVLFFALCYLGETDYVYTMILLATCFVTTLYATAYYILKFLIMTMFYDGDEGQNKFGISKFSTHEYDNMALSLSAFYFLFIVTVLMFILIFALI